MGLLIRALVLMPVLCPLAATAAEVIDVMGQSQDHTQVALDELHKKVDALLARSPTS